MTIGIVNIFRAGTATVIETPIDLRLVETHDKEATVVTTPIEDGTNVTDHIILQPDIVTVQAEVSNLDGFLSFSTGERAKTAWLDLKQKLNSRQLFDLVTTHENYTNMALSRIFGENSAPFNGRLIIDLMFIRVDLTQTAVIEIAETQLDDDATTGVSKSASSELQGGQLDAITATDNTSLAAQIVDAIREAFQ